MKSLSLAYCKYLDFCLLLYKLFYKMEEQDEKI